MATFSVPLPAFHGQTGAQRQRELEEYVFRLADQLRFVLAALDEDNFSETYNTETQSVKERIKALEEKIASL